MKVYFDATPSGLPELSDNYRKITETVKVLGHQHTNNFIISFDPNFYQLHPSKWSDHYKSIKKSIDKADVLIVEATKSSTSLGMCVEYGLLQGKPLIVLLTNNRKDIFLTAAGEVESKVLVIEYTLENLEAQLKESFEYIQEWMESRFTMVLPSDISHYLNRLAEQGVNRSEFIRQLIREKMGEQ